MDDDPQARALGILRAEFAAAQEASRSEFAAARAELDALEAKERSQLDRLQASRTKLLEDHFRMLGVTVMQFQAAARSGGPALARLGRLLTTLDPKGLPCPLRAGSARQLEMKLVVHQRPQPDLTLKWAKRRVWLEDPLHGYTVDLGDDYKAHCARLGVVVGDVQPPSAYRVLKKGQVYTGAWCDSLSVFLRCASGDVVKLSSWLLPGVPGEVNRVQTCGLELVYDTEMAQLCWRDLGQSRQPRSIFWTRPAAVVAAAAGTPFRNRLLAKHGSSFLVYSVGYRWWQKDTLVWVNDEAGRKVDLSATAAASASGTSWFFMRSGNALVSVGSDESRLYYSHVQVVHSQACAGAPVAYKLSEQKLVLNLSASTYRVLTVKTFRLELGPVQLIEWSEHDIDPAEVQWFRVCSKHLLVQVSHHDEGPLLLLCPFTA